MDIECSIFCNINGLRHTDAPTSLLLEGPDQASGLLRLQACQLFINDTPLHLDEGGRLLLRLLLLLLNNVL